MLAGRQELGLTGQHWVHLCPVNVKEPHVPFHGQYPLGLVGTSVLEKGNHRAASTKHQQEKLWEKVIPKVDNLTMDNSGHYPVLIGAVLAALQPVSGSRFVDATFGGGGYSRALLDAGAATVVGVDRDPTAVERGRALAAEEARFRVVEACFGDLADVVDDPVDGIVFDVGVSSFQLDAPERGFSFRADGPLDMRMGAAPRTAADLVNELQEAELADLIKRLGEEPQARRIAHAIVQRRRQRPFTRTLDLADVIRATLGRGGKPGIDPATRTFQALRMAVNDELGELERGLNAAVSRLAVGGRLVIVSFHSLEDRLVKRFLRSATGETPQVSRHRPPVEASSAALLEPMGRRVVRPDGAEIAANPRARSARLRAARRVATDGTEVAT